MGGECPGFVEGFNPKPLRGPQLGSFDGVPPRGPLQKEAPLCWGTRTSLRNPEPPTVALLEVLQTVGGASFCNGPDLLEETPAPSKLPRTSWRKTPGHSPLPQLEPEPLETQVLRLMELCTIEPRQLNGTQLHEPKYLCL
ncbi:hypothetical protein Syun_023018 [Stephania yunnanensis]|uniref:Uncharacterized protein n=1 Tax=Stephania yunnanensis TaxID=152371 RepID=A0AAP0I1Y5_9MAGN